MNDKELFKKSKVIDGKRYVDWISCLQYAEDRVMENKINNLNSVMEDAKKNSIELNKSAEILIKQATKLFLG